MSTIVIACCILHNFLIDEGNNSGSYILDKELNSLLPLDQDYGREERLFEAVAKDQREIVFQNWIRDNYKT